MNYLSKKLDIPQEKIIVTWNKRNKQALYASCGIKWPFPKAGKRGAPDFRYNKIAACTGDDYSDLEQNLYAIQNYKGISQPLGEIEIEAMMNFLDNEFDDFNALELWRAIDMAAAPDDPFKLKNGGETFNKFTNDYLVMILKPYRQYRQKLIRDYEDAEIAEIQKVAEAEKGPAAPPSRAQIFQDEKKFVVDAFDNICIGVGAFGLDRIYDILVRRNIVPDGPLKDFEKKARDKIKRDARTDGRVKTIADAITDRTEFGLEELQREAKRLATMHLFFTWRENKEHPETLFDASLAGTPAES